MKRTPTAAAYYRVEAQPKPVKNPYIGFTTFQHFEGDPLYSDITVDPRNNGLETEERECYPVPAYIEHKGNEQGFYPPTTIAYIRILWKDFERQRGQFNYALIADTLDRARAAGQTVMFRLLPHSTRASDDVPDWLKALTPCPERPDGKRVKDSPADPVYLRYFGEAIRALAARFDGDPVLDLIDVSITGAWGEGHGCDNYPREALQELMDVYTSSFHHTQLIGAGGCAVAGGLRLPHGAGRLAGGRHRAGIPDLRILPADQCPAERLLENGAGGIRILLVAVRVAAAGLGYRRYHRAHPALAYQQFQCQVHARPIRLAGKD